MFALSGLSRGQVGSNVDIPWDYGPPSRDMPKHHLQSHLPEHFSVSTPYPERKTNLLPASETQLAKLSNLPGGTKVENLTPKNTADTPTWGGSAPVSAPTTLNPNTMTFQTPHATGVEHLPDLRLQSCLSSRRNQSCSLTADREHVKLAVVSHASTLPRESVRATNADSVIIRQSTWQRIHG